MSRIGKLPVVIPAGVTVDLKDGHELCVKGPKGELKRTLPQEIDIEVKDGEIVVTRPNDLKRINDDYGHQYGDVYLKRACYFICRVFAHSPVFRIGGDEFAAILTGNDFEIADKLMVEIEIQSKIINDQTENEWEKINFASGIAFYDEKIDKCFSDVLARADENMYKQKKEMKHYQ